MNDLTEWWQALTRLSPFLIPVAAAIVALLIRDLLDPQQWRRLVRKSFAGVTCGILVFAGMASSYFILLQYVGDEESPIIVSVGVVIGLGIIPATMLASVVCIPESRTKRRPVYQQPFCTFLSQRRVANPLCGCAVGMPSGKCSVFKWSYLCFEGTYRRVFSEGRIWATEWHHDFA